MHNALISVPIALTSCGMVYIHETDYRILVGPISSIPPTPKQCPDILSPNDQPQKFFKAKKKNGAKKFSGIISFF